MRMTDCEDEAREFRQSTPRGVLIFRVAGVNAGPQCLLEIPEGERIEAYLAGDDVLVAAGRSLPVKSANAMREAARGLQLEFARFDLVVASTDVTVLDIDELPDGSAIDSVLRARIAESLRRSLLEPREARA
jgi:hypothetical protein